MKTNNVIELLKQKEDSKTKKLLLKINKPYEVIGVKMKDIKQIAKDIGINHPLAIELYKTNFYETMMLSTFIASNQDVTFELLTDWAKKGCSSTIINQGISRLMKRVEDYDVLLKEWCFDLDDDIRYAGFTMLSSYFGSESIDRIESNFSLNILSKISDTIANEPLEIQNAMNNAVVMAGLHVPLLVEKAYEVAKKIGYIMPLKAKNSCNIQSATEYLIRYKENSKYSRVAKLRQIE